MFGIKKTSSNPSLKNNTPASSNALNTIVSSTSIEGDIKSGNDIRIDGDLIGNLTCGAKVIIGPQGKVRGEINCINAVIEGNFEGILVVKELVVLTATAVVNADISYKKMAISSGASFNGECKMGNATKPTSNGIKTKSQNHKIVKRKPVVAK